MKKVLFTIIGFLAASMAFAQKPFEIQLSEEKTQDEVPFEINDEQGHFFIKINGELDARGRTPVQIELENNSTQYDFFLCDHAWDKNDLQEQLIYFAKEIDFKYTSPLERIKLNGFQNNFIPCNSGMRYTFPDILVEEGKTYECMIPIHLIKPAPNLFCRKKKKLDGIVPCTIRISVENKDEVYEMLQGKCDSLLMAFEEALERKEFCTNARHVPSFDEQTEAYINKIHELGNQVYQCCKSCPTESKKHKRYEALWDSINKMENRMLKDLEYLKIRKYDCGQHKSQVSPSCNYCKLTLEDIWKRMQSLYFDLRNEEKQKDEVLKEAKALYTCCTNHKKQERQWKDSEYKKAIEEYYKSIKNY